MCEVVPPTHPQVLVLNGVEPLRVSFPLEIDAVAEMVPQALCRQLAEGGRLVAVVGRAPTCRAIVYRSVAGSVSGWPVFDASAPLLPGFAEPPAFLF